MPTFLVPPTWIALSSAFTLAAWIRPDGAMTGPNGPTASVLAQPRASGGTGFRLGVGNGKASLGLNNEVWNCALSSTSTLAPDRWTHIAASYDGATMKIYFDGELEGSSTCASGPLPHSGQPVYIGREFDANGVSAGRYFVGLIDEVRAYDTALDERSLRALFTESRR